MWMVEGLRRGDVWMWWGARCEVGGLGKWWLGGMRWEVENGRGMDEKEDGRKGVKERGKWEAGADGMEGKEKGEGCIWSRVG